MTTGIPHDQNLEKQIKKQIGCMTGFLQIFDRQQILTGKRLNATKRLPPPSDSDLKSHSEKLVDSPMFSRELQKEEQQSKSRSSPGYVKSTAVSEICSPEPEMSGSEESPVKMPLPHPLFEFKQSLRSSWKFKEAPRLSLDSRATFDGKGSLYPREIRTNASILSSTRCGNSVESTRTEDNENQRRSPSVIARLMGLDALPVCDHETPKKAELRRSASESRVSRDLLQYRFIDGNNFQLTQSNLSNSGTSDSGNVIRDNAVEYCVRKSKPEALKTSSGGFAVSPWKSQQQPKSFFDSQDFFPEPKHTGTLFGQIEKRLKMRGIDEPAKDLDTLQQILEALQLKGLLHSKKTTDRIGSRNFVYDRQFNGEESPIVVIKPSRSPISINRTARTGTVSPASFRSKNITQRSLNFAGEKSDRSFQNERRARNSRSPDRNENNVKSPSSLARRRPFDIQRTNDSTEQRRNSSIHPSKSNPKAGSYQTPVRSPRNRKSSIEISAKDRLSIIPMEEESSTISESSFSNSSQNDSELQRSKMDELKEGKSLLERCDKLLHSISEITTSDMQPSPVSVLDSSFYKDESSPSPIMKRYVDFKGEFEDENWSPEISPEQLDDCDFIYVSEILRLSYSVIEGTDVFLLLEKHHYRRSSSSSCSKVSRLHRRLVFDTISEILDIRKKLPPWKNTGKPSLRQIWMEFQRIRKRETSEDLFEVVCGVLLRDLAGDCFNGWGEFSVEMSETVLDIERLIFKDLVVETIGDLAIFAGKNRAPVSRRKLVF